MITIKGSIPNISQAEAEVSLNIFVEVRLTVSLHLQVSSKLRAAYETDLNAMTPHSMMFPGLHPTAMMSTVGISSSYRAAPPTSAPGGVGGAAGGGGFVPGPGGGQAGGVRGVTGQGVSQETTFLYIPNSAVGAIIGNTSHLASDCYSSVSLQGRRGAIFETSLNFPGPQ